MEKLISKRSRLVTLLCMFSFPGIQHLYVGKIKNGITILALGLLINLNTILLISILSINYFFELKQNLNLFVGLVALIIVTICSVGFLLSIAISVLVTYLINYWQWIDWKTQLINHININFLLNLTIILLWCLAIWLVQDIITISTGIFKDVHGLPLMRKKLPYTNSKKSNIVAILLCMFLGPLGMHRMYLNKYKSAAFMFGLNLINYMLFRVVTIHPEKISINLCNILYWISVTMNIIVNSWIICDLFLLCSGTFTDAQNKLPRDYSYI